ncbi:amino acid--tRNA ligase-related protein [Clostridium sporogenes]|uniref:amino acid--tRNA ligase-related protein n=1 Tax=Clostridium sporogenes TaxID=1509 RepID=UPI003F92BA67
MKRILISESKNFINEIVNLQGWIHKIRKLKNITFLIIRDRSGLVQCIVDNNKLDLSQVKIESIVSIIGYVKESTNALNPFEIQVENLEIINAALDELPIEINKENLEINLDTMPLGEDGTHSFDLLFRGIEITTGGQRIHDYNMLIDNMKFKGFNPNDYESYLSVFKYGMPKHGGLAIGLERLTARLLELENVREAALITRDRTRLLP